MARKQAEPAMVAQIRQAIRRSGESVNRLSRRCGVSQPQISRFLNGTRTLTLPAAARLCEALGLRLTGPGGPVVPGPVASTPATEQQAVPPSGGHDPESLDLPPAQHKPKARKAPRPRGG